MLSENPFSLLVPFHYATLFHFIISLQKCPLVSHILFSKHLSKDPSGQRALSYGRELGKWGGIVYQFVEILKCHRNISFSSLQQF